MTHIIGIAMALNLWFGSKFLLHDHLFDWVTMKPVFRVQNPKEIYYLTQKVYE